jgi:hypothetical protein
LRKRLSLLGLIRVTDGIAVRILLDLNADPQKIRNELITPLSGPGGQSVASAAGRGSRLIDSL